MKYNVEAGSNVLGTFEEYRYARLFMAALTLAWDHSNRWLDDVKIVEVK